MRKNLQTLNNLCKLGFILLPSIFLASFYAYGQLPADSLMTEKKNALRIYIDCPGCDNDYLRTHITFVNHVRDRTDAQVHVLITSQQTGANGREHTITFFGKQNFESVDDTLTYISKGSDTEEMTRSGITQVIKLGLIRYAAKTPLGNDITISYSSPTTSEAVSDPWDSWVFRTSINGYFNGQSSTSSTDLYGSLSASRVTRELKLDISLHGSYGENIYDAGSIVYSSYTRSRGISGSGIFSLTDHLSTGVFSGVSSSSYSNEKLLFNIAPAIEYNIYSFEESTRRQLVFSYRVGFQYNEYEEETVYFKNYERLFKHRLESILQFKEIWGTITISTGISKYFHDNEKYNLSCYGSVSLRLIEGLSLRINGNASKVHDQLSLPRSGATAEEVLTRQKELATQYYYFASVGLSYTFGSIYNNVVNPRFDY